ncbi:hypothetical protein LENED_009285 [Lentinula edodes]|uniref:Uncharacterized protein n=1 Tax=Lentinula edodes TaxID=5353 RepID=A0A1Q3EJC0_LENED|nr:hypothetical protein LENED_009285 [Lentinula edodes]
MSFCRRSGTVLHFKAYLVLILGLVSMVYAAALPVTHSVLQLVHRAVRKAEVKFRRGDHHELPSGIGEPSSNPGQIESTITDAIHKRFGSSVPVTFVKHGETPDWANGKMAFDISWSDNSYTSLHQTGGYVQKVQEAGTYHLVVNLDPTSRVRPGTITAPNMEKDEFPTLDPKTGKRMASNFSVREIADEPFKSKHKQLDEFNR